MKKRQITYDEYKSALNLIIKYREQLENEIVKIDELVNSENINAHKFLYTLESNLNNRTRHALIKYFGEPYHDIRLADLCNISETKLRKQINTGYKTVLELKQFCRQYNIELKP